MFKKKSITHVYLQEEIDRILIRFKNNIPFVTSFLLACYTGMRTGEVFSLTWDDIDFENKKIYINKTVYMKNKNNNGRWYLGSTKTEGSTRYVYMCETLYKIMINYRHYQENNKKIFGKNYKKYYLEEVKNKYERITEYQVVLWKKGKHSANMVFTRKNGVYSGTDIIKYPYRIIHNELKIEGRFYDLRGTFATKTLRNGIEIKDVANVLGHTNIETTENYYIASTDEDKIVVSEEIEMLINSSIIDEISKYIGK